MNTPPAEGQDAGVHLTAAASVLLKIARTLPEAVMPASWEMALRLPDDVHFAIINALANNAARNHTLIASLMLAQATKLRNSAAPS